MTQPTLFTPPDPLNTHGVVERHGDHYAATCAACGLGKHVPADVGRATAECTLRYAGWKRGGDKRWRCEKCVEGGER